MSDFEKTMQDVLRSSERELDADTTQRLAQARMQALDGASQRRMPRFFVPVTGMALASVLALVLVLSPSLQNPQMNQDDVLLSEGLDLYEDMDFYYWLASEENNLQS
tara:strand:- start:11484 stop:11804 length:321 start_codon:yes stop_codon:yes gene_type:complete